MLRLRSVSACLALAVVFTSCSKDNDDVPTIPASEGSSMQLNGLAGSEAGANAGNSVFVDLSSDKQTSVLRTSWDLGFYSGAEFRVILNNTTAATAKVLSNRANLADVTAADTAGFADQLALGQGAGTFAIIDDVDGDISKTVIASTSATESENKVYIIKPSNGMVSAARDYYKVRVLRNGTAGYTLQYAKLSETTAKTIQINKDAKYNFNYVSFDNGAAVTVEPEKASWDFQWTLTTYRATPTIPYTYSDYIYINTLGGVRAAEVLTSKVSYENFATTNITDTLFNSSNKTTIGGNWRITSATPPATVGVRTDRFYVLRDASGNVYKIKFLSFNTTDGGTRGKPQFEYKLVRKA